MCRCHEIPLNNHNKKIRLKKVKEIKKITKNLII